jgi:hypothetical protein
MSLAHHSPDLSWMASGPPRVAQRPAVPRYRVGEPLQRGRRTWPRGAQYHHAGYGHELILFEPDVDEAKVQDVRFGEGEFAVVVRPPLLVFAYRFGTSIPWGDTPYNWYMQPPQSRLLPTEPANPQTRALLWITLAGCDDGIIHAQRGMTLDPDFSRTLHRGIRALALTPLDSEACACAVHDLLVDHPTTDDRLALASARTIGNQ